MSEGLLSKEDTLYFTQCFNDSQRNGQISFDQFVFICQEYKKLDSAVLQETIKDLKAVLDKKNNNSQIMLKQDEYFNYVNTVMKDQAQSKNQNDPEMEKLFQSLAGKEGDYVKKKKYHSNFQVKLHQIFLVILEIHSEALDSEVEILILMLLLKDLIHMVHHKEGQIHMVHHKKVIIPMVHHKEEIIHMVHHKEEIIHMVHHKKVIIHMVHHKEEIIHLVHSKEVIIHMVHHKEEIIHLVHNKEVIILLHHNKEIIIHMVHHKEVIIHLVLDLMIIIIILSHHLKEEIIIIPSDQEIVKLAKTKIII